MGAAIRLTHEEYYWKLAQDNACRSSCLRMHVGAVIVDPLNKRPIASGYNGAPSGVLSCFDKGTCYRIENNIPSGTRQETCCSIHAEANAIGWAGFNACRGMDLYIWGHDDACIPCKRLIVNARIERIWVTRDGSTIKQYAREDLIRELSSLKLTYEIKKEAK